jgi:signal transduction histidine kinase
VRWLIGLLVSVALVAAVTAFVELSQPGVRAVNMMVPLYLFAVLPVAIIWGTALAVLTSVLSTAVDAYLFMSPVGSFRVGDPLNLLAPSVVIVIAVIVGELTTRLRRAARQSARLSQEQSALRRVATLVAQSAEPPAVFEAVTREVAQLCGADLARMERYEEDGTVTGVAAWSKVPVRLAVGTRFDLDGVSIARGARRTGGPVRVDSFGQDTGTIAREARELGICSSVGCPVVVAGRLWGVIAASTKSDKPFPANTESQISEFTKLVATAVENAQSRAELKASRARVIAAADESRRRVERDLHDGAQQRLVSLGLELRLAQTAVPAELPELRNGMSHVVEEVNEVLNELRDISHGIHPAILSKGGLGWALRILARRSKIPVELDIKTDRHYPEPVELAAYCVVSEALTNITKHAGGAGAVVVLEERDSTLRLLVRDDGPGGANPGRGSGLTGLRDRVESLGGLIEVRSPPGGGTSIAVSLPTRDAG